MHVTLAIVSGILAALLDAALLPWLPARSRWSLVVVVATVACIRGRTLGVAAAAMAAATLSYDLLTGAPIGGRLAFLLAVLPLVRPIQRTIGARSTTAAAIAVAGFLAVADGLAAVTTIASGPVPLTTIATFVGGRWIGGACAAVLAARGGPHQRPPIASAGYACS